MVAEWFRRQPAGAYVSLMRAVGTARLCSGYAAMAIEFYFTPELHLRDGRVIRHLDDAIGFAREQELRPGVDQRDEILHAMERATTREEAHAAAHQFLRWLEELEVVA
jgi:hypothetical protein